MKIVVGGYLIVPVIGRKQLSILVDPGLEELSSQLEMFSGEYPGLLVAKIEPEPDFGPVRLVMYTENGRYLLMLEDFTEEGECLVRTLNDSSETGLVALLGEPYPAAAVTSDFSLICRLFCVFLKQGDVPWDVLSE